ncbi:MAG: hypothetical protein EBQ49_02790 [Verrucomicrobia bacterium]|nr:hypothetical protein [Verrucomicrobiota bacterium]
MTRLALIFTLFITALQAQSRRIEKTPETIQAEVEAEIVRTRLDLAESQRRQAKQASDLEIKKLEWKIVSANLRTRPLGRWTTPKNLSSI